MPNVGDYVDRIMATEHDDKRHFEMLAEAINTDPETQAAGITWEVVRARPLDAEQVLALSDEMMIYAREEIRMEPEALYDERRGEWHAFLGGMHRIAAEMGIEVPIQMIDKPITPTEMLVRAGMAEVTAEGTVVLTKEGRDTAKQFEQMRPEDASTVRAIVEQIQTD